MKDREQQTYPATSQPREGWKRWWYAADVTSRNIPQQTGRYTTLLSRQCSNTQQFSVQCSMVNIIKNTTSQTAIRHLTFSIKNMSNGGSVPPKNVYFPGKYKTEDAWTRSTGCCRRHQATQSLGPRIGRLAGWLVGCLACRGNSRTELHW